MTTLWREGKIPHHRHHRLVVVVCGLVCCVFFLLLLFLFVLFKRIQPSILFASSVMKTGCLAHVVSVPLRDK